MNFSLLLQLCGVPLVIALAVLCVSLSAMALYLALGIKQIPLLTAFFPLTLMPILAGLFSTMIATIASINLHLNRDMATASDPAFLLLMNAVPLLAGFVAATPAALITIISRWLLAWKASGLRLLPQKSAESGTNDQEAWKRDEADAYVRDLVRPR